MSGHRPRARLSETRALTATRRRLCFGLGGEGQRGLANSPKVLREEEVGVD